MCIFAAAAGATAAAGAASTAATMANIGMALSATQGIMQYQAGRRGAKASRAAYARSSQSANEAARRQMDRTRKVQSQEEMKMAEEIQGVARESRVKQSTLFTSSMESGVQGQSINQLLDDFERQEAEYRNTSRRNFAIYSDNIEDQLYEIQLGTRERVDAMRSQVKAPPSFAATALQIGVGALDAVNNSGLMETRTAATQAGVNNPITTIFSDTGEG